ncbi:GNAT family N-acetyltransferase [Streptomyces verrucosisporus]|uniref:GNAT family N-acetyltransferase n=1 Tax=Streptomyces verrucosisporus TaxID=1695161 RepID=UPI0019CFCC32|nr:GNAT family N-acetyltransferase [Streptomyces verrucosisporus]MBN3930899.1 GNAT family N-acetyltransferase [Streptomyces verrucosisporus]
MSGLRIRPASAEELPTVEELLIEASEWLASRGIDQWQFPPHRDRIQKAIRHAECFLAVDDEDRPIGTITVDDHADPEFWTEADDPGSALYVHRMATSRAAAGRDVGAVMLDWATKRAAQQGKGWLRLDAWKTNPGLHRYYERQGFTLVRLVDLEHRKSGALFQRPT